jgi:hypothetical protein
MFGYLPNKLRQALSGLGAAPADAALEAFHSFCGGLANGLRSVDSNLSAIETRIRGNIDDLLEPVGQAQLRADLALRANFAAGSASVSLSREAVARVNPGRLRDDISGALEAACDRIRQAVNSTAVSAGEVFEKTAEILARSPLAAVTGELDKFLAALDPEPLAVEFEEFVAAVLKKALSILPAMEGAIKEFIARMRVLVRELNPGTQALNFLSVLEVLREELDVLNPRRLAADLAIVHVAIREAICAYDPGVLATEIGAILKSIADKLKTLNPAALLGDLSFLDAIKAKIDEVAPNEAFAGVGESLKEVGKQLAALDPGSLLASVEGLAAPVEEAFEKVVKHIKHEIIALLESLKFALTSASVSVSASAEVG